jgi:serine/threonine protein kinase
MIGKTLTHYKILERIGQGGMAVVYKAEDTKLQRVVALKLLPFHLAESSEEKTRLVREARAAGALAHPNITLIYEIDAADGQPFIAMEYLQGKTLQQQLTTGPLSLDEILDIAIQVGEGLAAAHAHGILHRDLKSSNIMITPKGDVKIMDFGLAHLKDRPKLTMTGCALGSLPYSSPEQVAGAESDERGDIFSFGVVLYKLLAGKLPFRGKCQAELVYAILNVNPAPLTERREEVPPALEKIVGKALEKTPAARYQSVAEMLADLRQLQRSRQIGNFGKRKSILRPQPEGDFYSLDFAH